MPTCNLYRGDSFKLLKGKRYDLILTDSIWHHGLTHLVAACRRLYVLTGEALVERGDATVPGRKFVAPFEAVLRSMDPAPTLVVDPYLGSGSVAIAALNLGIDVLGIELEEKRLHYAASRIQAAHPEVQVQVWTDRNP